MITRIGYQGAKGSNSEVAALKLAERMGIENAEYIPLITSEIVADKLKSNDIDYGVMAVKNSVCGLVDETQKAFEDYSFETIASVSLPIHHCLFKRSLNIPNECIDVIVSHIHALNQTRKTINNLYPGIRTEAEVDTALSARKLANGAYSDSTAVVCRKNAGEYFGLSLICENIEDDVNNETEFALVQVYFAQLNRTLKQLRRK